MITGDNGDQMKKTITSLALALALSIPALGVLAGCTRQQAAKPARTRTISDVCPVMGMDVNKAAAKSIYKGKTYYFCCDTCKPKFDKDPESYINKMN